MAIRPKAVSALEIRNQQLEKEIRNDELCLCDDIYTDEEIKEFALSGLSRVRDEVLERLFTPEEIVEIKKRRKAHVDAENARRDAADEEERKQLEQEVALKLELRKKAEEERRREWYRKRCNLDNSEFITSNKNIIKSLESLA